MHIIPLIITLAVVSLIFVTRWRQTGPWRAFLKANGDKEPLLNRKELIIPGRVELLSDDVEAIIRSYLDRATLLCPSTNLVRMTDPLLVRRTHNGIFLWGTQDDLNNRIQISYKGGTTAICFTSIPNYQVLVLMFVVGIMGGWTALVPVIVAILIRKYDIDCTSAFVAHEAKTVLRDRIAHG
ncbi:MAG: hypothetical protein U0S12_12935 [Fimbriimonadales bacterium]